MKKLGKTFLALITGLALASCSSTVVNVYTVNQSLETAEAKKVLDPNIQLYFGEAVTGSLAQHSVLTTHTVKRVQGQEFNNCNQAFLEGLVALQNRAKALGATKVSGVVSKFRGSYFNVPGQYECYVNNSVARVSLLADIKR